MKAGQSKDPKDTAAIIICFALDFLVLALFLSDPPLCNKLKI